ncbi:unnamed protein product, partial [marine sediment metagenome]
PLKINDPRMFKPLTLSVPNLIQSDKPHRCYNEDANELIRRISCDILYVDPPYNTRQYAPNYHILETVAVWDKKIKDTTTGLRPWEHQKSAYSYVGKSVEAFEDLITSANCKYLLFSYNTEGLMPRKEIIRVLSLRGKPIEYLINYRRYKSHKVENPKEKLKELLFFVEVSK